MHTLTIVQIPAPLHRRLVFEMMVAMALFLVMLFAHPFLMIQSQFTDVLAAEVSQESQVTAIPASHTLSYSAPEDIQPPQQPTNRLTAVSTPDAAPYVAPTTKGQKITTAPEPKTPQAIPQVPFFSQFRDIDAPEWKKVGCGIASIAMLINFYEPNAVSANTLLQQGIEADAYLPDAGWTHQGLIGLSQKYGLDGDTHNLGALDAKAALGQFKEYLKDGPVIASVHYKFDPLSTIPHLVVIDGIDGDTVYYNDPAATGGHKWISVTDFLEGWKKRFIVVRPAA